MGKLSIGLQCVKEDRVTGEVRADRANPRGAGRLHQGRRQEAGASFFLPAVMVATKPSRRGSMLVWSPGGSPASVSTRAFFGTHSLRRTKATLIYRRTGNLRAVQLLLDHSKIESTVRYLGIEVDDALAIAEQVDV